MMLGLFDQQVSVCEWKGNGEVNGSKGEGGGGLSVLGVNSPTQLRVRERDEGACPNRLEQVEEGFMCDV